MCTKRGNQVKLDKQFLNQVIHNVNERCLEGLMTTSHVVMIEACGADAHWRCPYRKRVCWDWHDCLGRDGEIFPAIAVDWSRVQTFTEEGLETFLINIASCMNLDEISARAQKEFTGKKSAQRQHANRLCEKARAARNDVVNYGYYAGPPKL